MKLHSLPRPQRGHVGPESQQPKQDCDWVTYPGWRMVTLEPRSAFAKCLEAHGRLRLRSRPRKRLEGLVAAGNEVKWEEILSTFGGPKAKEEWRKLMNIAMPLGEISKARGQATAFIFIFSFIVHHFLLFVIKLY